MGSNNGSAGLGTLVVAFGGNAIAPEGDDSIQEQFKRTRATAERLADLVQAGYRLVITHGNGPQVGDELRRVELAAREVTPLPLDVCVADTQGGMGYMIAQCLDNALHRRGLSRGLIPVVTTVEVDRNDPAFANPTKPIGATYSRERAEQLQRELGYRMMEIRGRGWRRVVASPRPRKIVEMNLIRRLVEQGELLIAAGGGGIPVWLTSEGDYVGCEAVIDKDRTSAMLAHELGAKVLVIATAVERVALDYGKPTQRFLDTLSPANAREYLRKGQFPAGSMGPKVESAAAFVQESQHADARAIICHVDHLQAAVEGTSGTTIQSAGASRKPQPADEHVGAVV